MPKKERSHKRDPQCKSDLDILNRLFRDDAGAATIMYCYRNMCQDARTLTLNRIFSYILDKSNLECARELKGDLSDIVNTGTIINLIRYHLLNNDPGQAAAQYIAAGAGALRKRSAILIYSYMFSHDMIDKACEFYRTYCIGAFPVSGNDIDMYISYQAPKHELKDMLSHALGQPVEIGTKILASTETKVDVKPIIPDPDGTVPDGKLELLGFTSDQRKYLIDGLQRRLTRKGVIPAPNAGKFGYIVDGANVMFYYDRKITLRSYHRVTNMLKTLHRRTPGAQILLVLHERHFRPKDNKWDSQANKVIDEWGRMHYVTTCVTPKGVCDDYYQLLNAFNQEDSLLISNDQFRDHISSLSKIEGGMDLIRQWRKECVIEYHYDRGMGNPILSPPAKYSYRVQSPQDGIYYVPCNDAFVRIDTN